MDDAIEDNNIEHLTCLLQHGLDVNELNHEFKSPLQVCIEKPNCNLEITELLIQSGADVNFKCKYHENNTNQYDTTLFHIAVRTPNNTKILKLLLDNGADIESKNYYESTPLREALSIKKNLENIRFLLEHGADVNELDENDSTPLHEAAKLKNNLRTIKLLVLHGANINAKNMFGYSALHEAAKENNFEVVKFLVENGAEVTAETFYSKLTPLSLAVEKKANIEIVQFLLQHGVSFYRDFVDHLSDHYKFNSVQLVIRDLIKLKMLKLISDDKFSNIKFLNEYQEPEMEIFEKLCKAEAEKLRKKFICSDRSVTFADILTKNLKAVGKFFDVEDIRKSLDKIQYKIEFPIYSAMLIQRIGLAAELADVFRVGYQSLNYFLRDDRLPHTFLDQTLSYLTKNEIQNLNTAVIIKK